MSVQSYDGILGRFEYDDEEFSIRTHPEYGTILQYIGKGKDGSEIKIPDGITDLTGMFRDSGLMTAPKIPEGVIQCQEAFMGCRDLTSVPELPEGIENCRGMFRGCEALVHPPKKIPESVKNIRHMFDGCDKLESIPLPPKELRGKESGDMGKWKVADEKLNAGQKLALALKKMEDWKIRRKELWNRATIHKPVRFLVGEEGTTASFLKARMINKIREDCEEFNLPPLPDKAAGLSFLQLEVIRKAAEKGIELSENDVIGKEKKELCRVLAEQDVAKSRSERDELWAEKMPSLNFVRKNLHEEALAITMKRNEAAVLKALEKEQSEKHIEKEKEARTQEERTDRDEPKFDIETYMKDHNFSLTVAQMNMLSKVYEYGLNQKEADFILNSRVSSKIKNAILKDTKDMAPELREKFFREGMTRSLENLYMEAAETLTAEEFEIVTNEHLTFEEAEMMSKQYQTGHMAEKYPVVNEYKDSLNFDQLKELAYAYESGLDEIAVRGLANPLMAPEQIHEIVNKMTGEADLESDMEQAEMEAGRQERQERLERTKERGGKER